MNITVENLGPCKRLLRVEEDAQEVDKIFEDVTTSMQRKAKLPGFRPGKVPRAQVAKIFSREIEEEAKRQLISESYKKAIDEKKLHVIGYPDIEEIQFQRGQPLQYAATFEIAPEFELPEYKGLPVKIASAVVTQADMDRAMSVLREQRATYQNVDRPAVDADFVVLSYAGTVEGKSVKELVEPNAANLGEQQKVWFRMEDRQDLPGFTRQLEGAKAGEHRQVNVEFPSDYPLAALQGKKALYEVDVLEVKERILPELDEEFAKAYGAADLDKLREGVRKDLQNELNYKQNQAIRNQLLQVLSSRVSCDLPDSVVQSEIKNVVYDIVRDNQERGISREMIDQKKDEIYSFASNNAKERVKIAFLLGRIADQENIKASKEEVMQRIALLAQRYQIKPERLIKQLQERDGVAEIVQQIVSGKVLDFLQLHAKIEDTGPADPTA